jgi:hypothetical protein
MVMPESRSHKIGKGSASRKEVPISRGRRLDAKRGNTAIEVERSGRLQKIGQAIRRLDTQRNSKKILRVPQSDMGKAIDVLHWMGRHKITVTNLSKTKRQKP